MTGALGLVTSAGLWVTCEWIAQLNCTARGAAVQLLHQMRMTNDDEPLLATDN